MLRGSRIKKTDAAKLQDEYAKLVEGLQEGTDEQSDEDAFMTSPVLPEDLLKEAIPGNIRKAEHFVAFLKRFVEYLKVSTRPFSLLPRFQSILIRTRFFRLACGYCTSSRRPRYRSCST